MQLSTRGRYAVMALLDLAHMQSGTTAKPVTLADIAERQDLSLSYLEQLFSKLRKAKIVNSVRGPGGGYVLADEPHNVYLSQIVDAVEEEVAVTRCSVEDEDRPGAGCVSGKRCNAHDLWSALTVHINLFLNQVNLQMILDGNVCSTYRVCVDLPMAKAMANEGRTTPHVLIKN